MHLTICGIWAYTLSGGVTQSHPATPTKRCQTSLAPQTLHRVRQRRLHALHAYCQKCHGCGQRARCREYPPVERYVVGEIAEPGVHGPPGDRCRQHEGNTHQQHEIARQQSDHPAHAGAHDLADADLLGAPADRKRSDAEQAQAGDTDRQQGAGAHDAAHPEFRFVQLVEVVVEEGIGKGLVGQQGFPGALQGGEGCRQVFPGDPERELRGGGVYR